MTVSVVRILPPPPPPSFVTHPSFPAVAAFVNEKEVILMNVLSETWWYPHQNRICAMNFMHATHTLVSVKQEQRNGQHIFLSVAFFVRCLTFGTRHCRFAVLSSSSASSLSQNGLQFASASNINCFMRKSAATCILIETIVLRDGTRARRQADDVRVMWRSNSVR